jgi:hypothetical protein
MEIITGYFTSRQQSLEAAEYLRNKGFKDKISVMGENREEQDVDKTDNLMRNNNILGGSNYGVSLGFGGVPIGLTSLMLQGTGQIGMGGIMGGITIGSLRSEVHEILSHWGVPEKEGEEIKRVIDSGNSVILIQCEDDQKQFINDTLQHKGAQSIHI